MMLSPGRHAARTPGASVAFTPSTTHGGHPRSRGARVATTMASSVRCSRVNLLFEYGDPLLAMLLTRWSSAVN
jgi:hypothetical protein